jgi:hypothetical protein
MFFDFRLDGDEGRFQSVIANRKSSTPGMSKLEDQVRQTDMVAITQCSLDFRTFSR